MREELIAYISEIYNIPTLSEKSGEVTAGTLSVSTVLWNGKDRFFLKQYRDQFTEDRVKDVHHVKQYFSDGGIPVILPLQTRLGSTYFTFGGHMYALFPFINETHLDRSDMPQKAMENMAIMLGKIHLLGKNSSIKINRTFKPWNKQKMLDIAEKIDAIIKGKKSHDDFDTLAKEDIDIKVELVKKNTKVFEDFNIGELHLTHGDYHDHNLFFNDKEDITHVFDFEKTDMSPRCYELIRSMHFTCLDGNITDEKIENAKLYLKAYNTAYPISKDEFSQGMQVYFLKMIHSLWILEEYYLGNNYRPSIFLAKNIDTLKYMQVHLDELTKKLASVL